MSLQISHENREGKKLDPTSNKLISVLSHLLPMLMLCLYQSPVLTFFCAIIYRSVELCVLHWCRRLGSVPIKLWEIFLSLNYLTYSRIQVKNRLKLDKDAHYIALYNHSLNKNHSKMEENLLQYLCIVWQEHCRLFHAAWPTCLFLT